jgi:hypothetical protein
VAGLFVFVADTRTGRVLDRRIPFVGMPSCGYRLNTEGPLSIRIPMTRSFSAADMAQYLSVWKFTFGVAIGSHILQAGPVCAQPEYDADAEEWVVTCAGMWKLFNDKRIIYTDRSYLAKSFLDIARGIVNDDLAQTDGSLPIDLPALDGLGGHDRTFEGNKLPSVGSALQNLTDDIAGPEMEFRPYFPDTQQQNMLRWLFKVGTPHLGQQGSPHRWYAGKTLVTASVSAGSARLSDIYFVPGNGTGEAAPIGVFTAPAASSLAANGWPLLMDVDTSHVSAIEQGTLNGYAENNYNTYRTSVRTLSAVVRMDPPDGAGPRVSEWALGDTAVFSIRNYTGLLPGEYTCRIIGAEPVSEEDIALELQVLTEVPL